MKEITKNKVIIDKNVARDFDLDLGRELTDEDGNIILDFDPFWADCFIYQMERLDGEATYYLNDQIPQISEILIPKVISKKTEK